MSAPPTELEASEAFRFVLETEIGYLLAGKRTPEETVERIVGIVSRAFDAGWEAARVAAGDNTP